MKSVLIIDDSKTVREHFKLVLEGAGYSVLEADNGQIGFNVYKEKSPDIVITDIYMPIQDGIETISKINKENVGARIIAMTDGGKYGDFNALNICKKMGIDKCIKKPIGRQELLKALNDL